MYVFIYLFERKTDRKDKGGMKGKREKEGGEEKEKEKAWDTELSPIIWLTSQMALITRVKPS